ncbi:hypothetical protein SmJEL517_g01237 [Synchytrium microbalum]|uniref:Nucleoporin Nup186/Nup192/Nup205 n=1 Tax=Synchytrium microbalum TaxID=1806994 RepID=A0A507CBM2_9FUNG|nr:uncharacterized protein SmJEL517_g01237 [Synchytrium microbalum]TPX36549.1 hypothetical protein SmJEL517_g01237 [Synchytrium microbalum]
MARREFDSLEDFAQLITQIPPLDGHLAVEHLKNINANLPRFIRELDCFFKEPPKDASLREQALKGTVYLNQQFVQANEAYGQTVVLISDILDVTESRATSLLSQAQTQAARFDRDVLMTAILLYHRGRRYVADSLVTLLNFTTDGRIKESIRRVLRSFVDDIFDGITGGEAPATSPVSKMLNALEDLKNREKIWSPDAEGYGGDQCKVKDATTRMKAAGLASSVAEDVIRTHVAHLINTRKDMVVTLWAAARYRQLTIEEMAALIKKLREVEMTDPTAFPLLTTVLAAQMTPPFESPESNPPIPDEYVASIERELIPTTWAVKELQAIVCFRWAVYLRHEVSRSGTNLTVSDEHIQQIVRATIAQGALHHIYRLMETHSKLLHEYIQTTPSTNMSIPARNIVYLKDGIAIDTFEAYTISAFRDAADDLIASMCRKFGRIVKELKNHDEDVVPRQQQQQLLQQHHQQQPKDTFGQPGPEIDATANRRDFEYLLKLIALVHSFRHDSGYAWWTEVELCKFLKWASEVRTEALVPAYLEMLASLAHGPQSSGKAYEFLSATDQYSGYGQLAASRVSWIVLFRTLNQYAAALAQAEGREISPKDAAALCAYLRILRNVVHFDEMARTTLHQNQHYRAVYALLQLFVCRVAVDVKAALLNAVAAFCIPSSTGGDSITVQVWRMLEQAQIIPRTPPPRPGQVEVISPGLVLDLEEVETNEQRYPETIAFLKLMNILMKSPTITQIVQPGPVNMMSGAGDGMLPQGHGMLPYVRYVLERLLYKMEKRPFADPDEKWSMTKECLEFANSCLVSFDAWVHEMGITRLMTPIGCHPAIEVYFEIFAGRPLLGLVTQIIGTGVESVNERKWGNHNVESVKLALHIVHNVLRTQKLVLESLKAVSPNYIASLASLDDRLSHSRQYVIDIAEYVSCTVGCEIPLVSIQILAVLSQSSSFIRADRGSTINQLVSILDTSAEKKRIIYGFMNQMTLAEGETGFNSLVERASAAGDLQQGTPTTADIRAAIFDVLLAGLSTGRSSALALFLLGKLRSDGEIPHPESEGAALSCFHSIVRLVAVEQDAAPIVDPIVEKALHVLFYLTRHPNTSRMTLRYLRHHEGFVVKQLATLPTAMEVIEQEDNAQARHERVLADRLCLHQQAWLMDIAAIELRLLQSTSQQSEIDKVMQVLLYTAGASRQENNGDDDFGDDDIVGGSTTGEGQFEQSLPRMMEVLAGITLDRVQEPLANRPLQTRYFGLLQADIRINEHGEEIYDVTAVLDRLHRMGSQIDRDAVGSVHIMAMRDEMRLILENLVEKNLEQELSGSIIHALSSWCKLADFVTRSFMSSASYVDVIKQILNAVLAKANQSPIQVEIASALAPVIEALIVRLVEHLSSSGLDGTYQAITRLVLDFFLRNEEAFTPPARASALSGINQLFQATLSKPKTSEDDFWPGDNGADLSHFSTYWKQLVFVLCRDASDGDAVVMVPALALLDTLCSCMESVDSTDIINAIIVRNALATFIESIGYDDERVIRALTEAEDVVPISICKLKLQLLVRIAQTRDGVMYLLNSNLLGILTRARFLDYFQEGSRNPELFEHFTQITHVVFEIVLQVLEYARTDEVYSAVAEFILTHADTFRAILSPPKTAVLTIESLRAMKYASGLFMLLRKGRVLLNRMGIGAGRRTLHGMMVSLLDKLSNQEELKRRIQPASAVDDFNFKVREPLSKRGISVADLQAERLFSEIQYNVLVYCLSITVADSSGDANAEISSSCLKKLLSNKINHLQLLGEDSNHIQGILRKSISLSTEDMKEIVMVHSSSTWKDLAESEREHVIEEAVRSFGEDLSVQIRSTWASIEMLLALLSRLLRRELPQKAVVEDIEGLKRDLSRLKQQASTHMNMLQAEEKQQMNMLWRHVENVNLS